MPDLKIKTFLELQRTEWSYTAGNTELFWKISKQTSVRKYHNNDKQTKYNNRPWWGRRWENLIPELLQCIIYNVQFLSQNKVHAKNRKEFCLYRKKSTKTSQKGSRFWY